MLEVGDLSTEGGRRIAEGDNFFWSWCIAYFRTVDAAGVSAAGATPYRVNSIGASYTASI